MHPNRSAEPNNRVTIFALCLLICGVGLWLFDLLILGPGVGERSVAHLAAGIVMLTGILALLNEVWTRHSGQKSSNFISAVNHATSLSGVGLLHYFPDQDHWRLNHLAQAMLKRSTPVFTAPLEELLERVHPEDLVDARRSAELAINGDGPVSGVVRLGDAEDGYAVVRYQIFPADGGSLVATLVDMDRLTHAENTGERNLRRLTQALEVTGAVLLELDVQTGNLICGRRAQELLGLEADATFDDLINSVNESYRDDFRHRLETEEGLSRGTPYPLTLPDGQEHWIRFTTHRSDESQRLSITAIDLTQQTLQEHQQRSLVVQLSAAAEAAHISIFDEDIEAEELTPIYQPAKEPNEFYAGHELLLHIPVRDHKKLVEAQNEVGSFTDITFIRDDGRRTALQYSVIEEFYRKGRRMRRVLVQNVSEQASQKEQLQQTIVQMERVQQQLESKVARERQMFAVIGHELRTPAASIKMILDDISFAEHSDEARIVTEQVEHLLSLLDDVRVLVNPERVYDGKESRVQLTDLLNSALKPLAPLLRDHRLHASLVADEGAAREYMINTQMLRQLVMNLVRNAALHSGGSFINLVVRTREIDDLHSEVILRFEDNGKGVKESLRSTLFEPFHRDNSDSEGMGLGLSICAALASKMGGSISYSDYPGGGAVFQVKIVAAHAESGLDRALPESGELKKISGDWSKLSVLLAEDNSTIHLLTSKMLTTRGAKVFSGRDGVEALALYDQHPVDLVITDIFMPNMDGYELVRNLRNRGFDGPVVGVSAAVVGTETEELLKAGADVVLSKPLRMSELEHHIAKLGQIS